MNRKIVISVNTAWNIYNFRSGLVKALVGQGYEVMVMARDDEYSPRLTDLGCRFIGIHMDNNGTSLGRDLALLIKYWRVLRAVQPLVYLGYTIKPNVYGSMAANRLGIPVINNIAGLGTTFINSTILTCLVKQLYRISLRRSSRIFFQNSDDRNLFIHAGIIHPEIADILPGSGIDLLHFRPMPMPMPMPLLPMQKRCFRFLLISRMLRDKGVEEFAEAAEIVRRNIPTVQFQLLGSIDVKNSNSISRDRILNWEKSGLIQYMNNTDDVRPYLENADCIVLPSYREGVPHSLLEAAAMARPIIASNVVGCKDIVDDNINGFLCKVKSGPDLAEKMMKMIRLTPEQRLEMGAKGRKKVVFQFDEKLVIAKYLNAIERIKNSGSGHALRPLKPNVETF